MFTKTTIISAIMATVALAAPAPRAVGDSFGLISIRSGSEFQGQAINAQQLEFYVGRNTSTYCPLSAELCPAGTSTAVTLGLNGTLFMNTEVPGGQQVYVASDGVLQYTTAHSAAIPAGASTTGFYYTAGTDGAVGSLTYGSTGFLACPGFKGVGHLILVDNGNVVNKQDCTGIAIGAVAFEGTAAWEYN